MTNIRSSKPRSAAKTSCAGRASPLGYIMPSDTVSAVHQKLISYADDLWDINIGLDKQAQALAEVLDIFGKSCTEFGNLDIGRHLDDQLKTHVCWVAPNDE